MPKKQPLQNENEDLLNKLKGLPRSSRSDPFNVLSAQHQEEWQGVRASWADGNLSHISISQLNRSVCKHFDIKLLSFGKFKKELERKVGT